MAQAPFSMIQFANLDDGWRQGKIDYAQIAEQSAADIAAGVPGETTTVHKVLLSTLPSTASNSNYIVDYFAIGKKVAFNVNVNLKIVNSAGVVIAGPAAGITFASTDADQYYIPMPCAQPGLTTIYDSAYLLITLASSNFAAQTQGAMDIVARFVMLPPMSV